MFIEIKLRRSTTYGRAEEAVSPAKARKLIKSAEQYLSEWQLDVPWRIDVVAIQSGNITLIQNAVTEEQR